MSHARVLAILLVLGGLLASAWWVAAGSGGGVESGDATATDEVRWESATMQASAAPTPAPGAAGQAGEREAIAATATGSNAPAIIGRVVDATGRALVGARVLCTPRWGLDGAEFDLGDASDPEKMTARARAFLAQRVTTQTDGEGHFRIAAAGTAPELDLRITAPAHLGHAQPVRRPKEGDYDAGTVQLGPAAIVRGRVLDRAGQPVAAALVRRENAGQILPEHDFGFTTAEVWSELNPDEATGRTDAAGRFVMEHAAPGDFRLSARHADHPTAHLSGLHVAAGEVLDDVVITLEPGLTISGKVIGAPAGLTGLRVLAGRRRDPGTADTMIGVFAMDESVAFGERGTEPARDGSFVLRGVAADLTYRVGLVQRGRGFAGQSACSQPLEVRAGAAGIELHYEAGVAVTFHVVDARNGAAIERLWVEDRLQGGGNGLDIFMTGGAARARDYPGGKVAVTNLRPKKKQTLAVTVEATGYAKFTREGIALPLRGSVDLGTARLERVPVVRVQVTAAADGAPVAGATVRLETTRPAREAMTRPTRGRAPARAPHAGKTDADGRCVLSSLPGTDVVLSVASKEFAPYASAVFTLPTDGDSEHHARLALGGSVTVEVVDTNGEPVAKANVIHRHESTPWDGAATDAQGRTTFDRLTPGAHRFRLGETRRGELPLEATLMVEHARAAESPLDDWQEVEVTDSGRAFLRLVKPRNAAVTGVVRENGKPLAAAQVEVVRGSSGSRSASARTDDEGRFRIEEARPGELQLRITHQRRAMPALVPVTLVPGDNVCDVDLDVAIVRGVVRGPDDEPVSGAAVYARGVSARSDPGAVQAMLPGIPVGRATAPDGPALTEADGRYELRGVAAAAKLVVRATAKGHAASESAPVEVARGSVIDGVDIELAAAGSVRVRAAADLIFASAIATPAVPGAGVSQVSARLRDGSTTLEGLRPGRWTVRLATPGRGEEQTRTVDVVAGTTVDVSF